MDAEIIIIGAGPTGLMAGYELARAGRDVQIIEARHRIGGRAHTIYNSAGSIEAGAEFVHGQLPITLSLLELAGLSYTPTDGTWVQVKNGTPFEEEEGPEWSTLMQKLKGLKEDMTLQHFLEQSFPEPEYAALKTRAIGFAEGYDSADAARVSAKALYEEWSKEEEEEYRIDKGYTSLMNFLVSEFQKMGGQIHLSHPVSGVTVDGSIVTIKTACGRSFTAGKVIIALPLGVLQNNSITFQPAVPAYKAALMELGFGYVVKYVFLFKDAFWKSEYPGLGFLFSTADVPTWWTQAPLESNVFTGWVAGGHAQAAMHLSDNQLRDLALQSLSQIFMIEKATLERNLLEAHFFNWSSDPYTMGSYAYPVINSGVSLKQLINPALGSIYFAGEYMYEGSAVGTVEAAFWSGINTAKRLLAN